MEAWHGMAAVLRRRRRRCRTSFLCLTFLCVARGVHRLCEERTFLFPRDANEKLCIDRIFLMFRRGFELWLFLTNMLFKFSVKVKM